MSHEVVHTVPTDVAHQTFKEVKVSHEGENTKAVVVTADGLPLLGFSEGNDPVSTFRALQDALGHTAPALQGVTAEVNGDKLEMIDSNQERWVSHANNVVEGVDYLLYQSTQKK